MTKRTAALLLLAGVLATPVAAFAAISHFSFFQWIPGSTYSTPGANPEGLFQPKVISNGMIHVYVYGIVCVLLIVAALALRPKLVSAREEDLIPTDKFGVRSLFEMVLETTFGLMREIIGPEWKRFVPLIGTLALFILFSNLIGILPGSATSNNNVNTTLAMAICVFIIYQGVGIKEHGLLGWMAHYMGPLEGAMKYILAPLMVPIEVISHLARPLSLTLRLFGNMTGDHLVIAVFMSLVVIAGNPIPAIYPIPFLILGMVVCIVQTLVFCLLTMVYLGEAVAHADHNESAKHASH
jgi:F-type H+-transporting ATPase subunit a